MRVGLSLLTLVPGEVGGAETAARGLARGLAEVGTLEYTALVPPAAPGAGEGLPEVLVTEYRRARTIPQRAFALALAEGRDEAAAVRFASAAAALKVQRKGGRSGAPTRAELDSFLAARGVA